MRPQIRAERAGDVEAIRAVHDRAFDGELEGRIVDALRINGALTQSLVAVHDGRVIGHVAFSPATIGDAAGAGLGPMAVLPAHQRQGIGTALIEAGLAALTTAACPFVVVVGHPDYYPRFGFAPAHQHGVRCEWEVPEDACMLRILDARRMDGVSGLARYRPEFALASSP